MMPTDLTKPNAKQIIQMPTDLLGIWLLQILRHHTDAISTVFVERRKYTSSTTIKNSKFSENSFYLKQFKFSEK